MKRPTKPDGQPYTAIDFAIGHSLIEESVTTGEKKIWTWNGKRLVLTKPQIEPLPKSAGNDSPEDGGRREAHKRFRETGEHEEHDPS